MRKLILLLTAMLVLPVLLSGCTASADDASNPLPLDAVSLRAAFLEKANAVTVSDTAVTFCDGMGQTVTLNKAPQNPAILYASFATLWVEAGGEVSLCLGGASAVELYREQLGRDLTADAGVTVVADSAQASRWDIERILAARPDLILCSTAMGGYAAISAPAASAGIPTVAVDYADFADYLKWFRVFCHLCGHPERWEQVALPALDAVVETVLTCREEVAPTALSLFTGVNTLKANTSNTVLGGMMETLGAVNAVSSPLLSVEHVELSLESVIAADPDVILIQCHTGVEDARALVARLYGDYLVWQSLRAVKAGRVYYLEPSLFHHKPHHRFADAYRTLAAYLYAS